MTTATHTLTSWLLERIAEDESAASAASPPPWFFGGVASVAGGTLYDATRRIADLTYEQPEDHDGRVVRRLLVPEADANGAHIARHDPARVLAECAAKRAIVALHVGKQQTSRDFYGKDEWDPSAPMGCSECGTLGEYAQRWPCLTLRHLAAVYADAPGYDAAWVVS